MPRTWSATSFKMAHQGVPLEGCLEKGEELFVPDARFYDAMEAAIEVQNALDDVRKAEEKARQAYKVLQGKLAVISNPGN